MGCGGSKAAAGVDSTQKLSPEEKYEPTAEDAEEANPTPDSPTNAIPWSEKSIIASGSMDKSATIWERNKVGMYKGTGNRQKGAVMGVALSRDGKFLVTACADKTAQVWDLNQNTQLLLFTLEHPDGVSAVALSNDGTCIITGCDDCLVRGWELQSGKELFCLESHTGVVLSVAVSNDSKRFASGSDDDTARVWDMESKKELLKLEGGTGAVGSVNFSRDNKFIATGTEGVSSPKSCASGFTEPRGFTCVWDLVSGEKKHMFPGHTAAFTRSSKRIAVGGDTGSVVVYKVESGEKIFEVKHPKFSDECFFTSIAFHRDGRLMVTGNNDRTIQIWDMVSRKFIRTLEGHSGPVMSVAVI